MDFMSSAKLTRNFKGNYENEKNLSIEISSIYVINQNRVHMILKLSKSLFEIGIAAQGISE